MAGPNYGALQTKEPGIWGQVSSWGQSDEVLWSPSKGRVAVSSGRLISLGQQLCGDRCAIYGKRMPESCSLAPFRQRLRESSRTTQEMFWGGYFGGRWVLRPVSVMVEKDLNIHQSKASGTSQFLWEGKACINEKISKNIYINTPSLIGMVENSQWCSGSGNWEISGVGFVVDAA